MTDILSGAFQVDDHSDAGANEIVRRNWKHVVPRPCRRPHFVVPQQIRVEMDSQLSCVTKGRHTKSELVNLHDH